MRSSRIMPCDARNHGFPVVGEWQAKWIWTNEPGDGKHEYVCFRKDWELPQAHDSVFLHVTGQREYTFWINGVFVGRGPTLCDPRYKRYDTYAISHLLKPGVNTLAAMVYHHNEECGSRRLVPNQEYYGFLCQIEAAGRVLTFSDEAWNTRRERGWMRPGTHFDDSTYPEFYNACAFPGGWRDPGFDASGWPKAVAVIPAFNDFWGAELPQARYYPWINLQPSETCPPEFSLRKPVKVEAGEVWRTHEVSLQDTAVRMSLEPIRPIEKVQVLNAEELLQNPGKPVTIKNSSRFEPEESFDCLRDSVLVLDFGGLMNARLGLRLNSQEPAHIDIGYAYKLEDGRVIPYVSNRTPQADCYIARAGVQEWQTHQWRHFRYVQLTFRDVERPLEVLEIWAEEVAHQFEAKGEFSSSSELLNQAWEMTERTTRLCCTDQTMDNPSRERKQYLGDCSGIVQSIECLFGETALLNKYFRQFDESQHQTGLYRYSTGHDNDGASLFDHSLSLPLRLHEAYLLYKDGALLAKMLPGVCKLAELCLSLVGKEGLCLLPPYALWFDWGNVQKANLSFPLNAFVARVLRQTADLIEWAGKNQLDPALLRKQAADIEAILRGRFFDSGFGAFFDSLDGKEPHFSEHSNSLAILWDIATPEQATRTAETYAANARGFSPASPAWAYLPAAFAHADRADLMVDWVDRKIGRLARKGFGTIPETWDLHAESTRGYWRCRNSRAVAQGAGLGVPWAMLMELCGIAAVKPGCEALRIWPKPGMLERFSGTLPGAGGGYKLAYEKCGGRERYEIILPSPVQVEFVLGRKGKAGEIAVGGQRLSAARNWPACNGKTAHVFALPLADRHVIEAEVEG